MPKQAKPKKRPVKVNPLAQYLVTESLREGGGPDAGTNAQVALLMAETNGEQGAGRAKPAQKAAKSRTKKKR